MFSLAQPLTPRAAVALVITALGAALPGAALADGHSCTFEGEPSSFDADQVAALYACISEDLQAGYASGDDPVAPLYRDWGYAQTAPASPGPHGGRFLNTFVNEVGFAAYTSYADDPDFAMPVGSVIAKESFSTRDGAPRPGPLFIMERVADADSPETDGWIYSAVQPNGQAMGISQSFCHDCHVNFFGSDSLGYPAPEVRLGM